MKFSKSWLQDYIVEQLPDDSVISDALNRKAFEVEDIVTISDDVVFDIKVLPNRAHDALCHHGMAYELCATLGLTFNKEKEIHEDTSFLSTDVATVPVSILDETACTRFTSVRIDGVTVGESPLWLKKRLEAIGQRSINNIVDITNYVQFSLNKPMHAYDARSIKGTLTARFAKTGETLLTLDDKNLTLDEATLVIADDEKVLGLAGIKGGKYSGIQPDTTSVILESANFSPTLIRKTAEKYSIRTDASKRFENGIANNLVVEGLHMTAQMIHTLCVTAKQGTITDMYPIKDVPYYVGISASELNSILGSSYSVQEIEETLHRLSFTFEKIIPHDYIKATYPTLIGAGYKNPTSMRYDAPTAFSCSSLVSYLYKGVWMPSLSVDKYVFCEKISQNDVRFGDLVFANSGEGVVRYESVEFLRGTKVEEGVDHVGMYVGEGNVLHATKVHGVVVKESLEDFINERKIIGYGRVIENLNEERYVIRVPSTRLDIRIKEDLAEEIGRILGYDKLTPVLPKLSIAGLLHSRAFYESKIREILIRNGFSEVMTYSFGDVGEVSIVKGLAEDKEKLRTSLSTGILESITRNLHNAPLLNQKTVKIFEIGNVFSNTAESRHLAIAIDDGMKKSNFTEEVDLVLSEIKRTLGVSVLEYETISTKPYVIECDVDALIALLGEPSVYEAYIPPVTTFQYKTFSLYPFIVRDIAVWVPESITWESIYNLCVQVKNHLVTRIDLFDTFSKEVDGQRKTSFAFRLVFQSFEKTLTDEEVNHMMEPYYTLLKEKGYEIR